MLRAHTAPGNKAFVQLNDGQELEIPVDLNTGAFQAPLNLNQGARNRIIVRAVDGTDSSKFSVVNRDIYLVDPGLTVMVPDGLDKDGNPLALNGLAVLSKDPWAAPVPNVDYRALPSGPVQFVGVKTGIGDTYL
ncbi:MAG: hypothetical protein M1553_13410, partial [Firmicutes bacterium]|nr:hypothetical protein [Bacillota bacterium]